MRKFVVAAVLAAGVAALATAALGRVKSPSSAAAPANAGSTALVSCGKTRSIGLMAPFTGPAASIGVNQVHWARFYVSNYNKATQEAEVQVRQEDTQLGSVERDGRMRSRARKALGSNSKVLAVVGPAGSNEVKATTGALKGAGLGFVSGSATEHVRSRQTVTRRGYFFRTVPTDDDQSKSVSAYIVKTLKLKRVYIIDDQEAYSIGLADWSRISSRLRASASLATASASSSRTSRR